MSALLFLTQLLSLLPTFHEFTSYCYPHLCLNDLNSGSALVSNSHKFAHDSRSTFRPNMSVDTWRLPYLTTGADDMHIRPAFSKQQFKPGIVPISLRGSVSRISISSIVTVPLAVQERYSQKPRQHTRTLRVSIDHMSLATRVFSTTEPGNKLWVVDWRTPPPLSDRSFPAPSSHGDTFPIWPSCPLLLVLKEAYH
ncbi:uncharacterized protein FFUJ_09040 [Fusarium fujikuroi IMI 58289]|uniref:Uncharacterized protein n=1 Tax=Gibberella fujikuroi (strain CBS 195.34 / IMI 58289 / NRRL A-6831) TaxID=1279085 RepID=S0EEY5_GIBF5|nr:uncharacterized protein FFUJ_09040 [Fusarium fujikuroi IMI 58289]KLP21986.1 uncharacterized protein LW94_7134 [Fusarium fujikuroi]CCT70933.1 uncharacterized protein FFUJ_09040 [Fusarium fujikuroi IMI 58289]SCO02646.1 uncharacterized protein FFM5_07923 [Fusarium fujikuroi]SCO20658.1 uncharacterized protein FFC1_13796 [Fusarium fujikuroi]SCO53002.1 uncharacterized protein FFMR_11321 [Fusarium fujikuroi]